MAVVSPPRVTCLVCGVGYAPRLTAGTCPVCDAPPPDGVRVPGPRRWSDPDDRLLAVVVAATVANVLLLALLSWAVLRS